MKKHFLKILWTFLILFYCIGFVFSVKEYSSFQAPFQILLSIFVTGLIVWIYLTIRLFIFKNKLTRFYKLLLSGDYEAGIKLGIQDIRNDEISKLSGLINKTGEQLRIYDKLRAERVRLSNRVLDIIYQNTTQGIIIANIERETFKLNPAAQSLFDIDQGNFSFDSIEKQEKNKEFTELFSYVITKGKVPQEDNVTIQLPVRDSQKKVSVKIIPIKDSEENVKLAIIFVSANS